MYVNIGVSHSENEGRYRVFANGVLGRIFIGIGVPPAKAHAFSKRVRKAVVDRL
jgi:hypothetical protein